MEPETNQREKSRSLFIVFALGFLAVLANGFLVLDLTEKKEAAILQSASVSSAWASSSRGISQILPPDPNAIVTDSAGILNEKALTSPKVVGPKKLH